jgi:hypothetical protein
MTHAAESLHWYDREGKPAYTVKARDGSDRPATLRDARKLNLVPSVTAIIRCASAPALEIWKQQQVLMAALTLTRLQDEPEQAYLSRIMADSREQAKKAAERGTAIHAAIQGHYENEPPGEGMWPYVQGAVRAVREWMDDSWTPERSFSHPLGFGGKIDLSGSSSVLDFKTKEFTEETIGTLKTWDEHSMQLAAYRHGLGMDGARCAIAYVSTTVPGLVKVLEISQEDLAKGWTMFYSLLHYWQAKSTYRSSFERLAA